MSDEINLDALFADEADTPDVTGPIVTIASGAEEVDVTWHEGMTLRDAINELQWSPSPTSQFWVNGTEAGFDTVLPEGAMITSVGKVAGGK